MKKMRPLTRTLLCLVAENLFFILEKKILRKVELYAFSWLEVVLFYYFEAWKKRFSLFIASRKIYLILIQYSNSASEFFLLWHWNSTASFDKLNFFPFRKKEKKRRIKNKNRKNREREREIINNDNNVVILSRGLSGVWENRGETYRLLGAIWCVTVSFGSSEYHHVVQCRASRCV